MKSMKLSIAAIAGAVLAGCTGSQVLVGMQRPPIDPSQVRVYLDPPAQFEKIAVLEANSTASWAFTDQQKSNKAVTRLKERAAALGANGVLFVGMHNQTTSTINSGQVWGNTGGLGYLGGSTNVYMKVGSGLAIYVPPGAELAAQQAEFSQSQAVSPPAPAPAQTTSPVRYEADPAKRCDACTRLSTP